jgi:hypothetical protein
MHRTQPSNKRNSPEAALRHAPAACTSKGTGAHREFSLQLRHSPSLAP